MGAEKGSCCRCGDEERVKIVKKVVCFGVDRHDLRCSRVLVQPTALAMGGVAVGMGGLVVAEEVARMLLVEFV